jgi:hypothetical protein
MMQRLREQASSSDEATARAAALLSAMRPLDVNRLRPATLPGPAARRGSGMGAGIRTGVVLACTLGAVAAAAATMRALPLRHAETGSLGPTPAYSVPSLPSPERGSATVVTVSEAEVHRPVAEAPAPASRAVSGVFAVRSLGAPSKASPAPALPSPASSPAPLPREALGVEDESTLIVRAVRALRREGDPMRAEELAEQALLRFPHGAQVEEATALVMEAASARGDALGARRAAETYLDRFRSGRFAGRAQRLLASPER